MRVTATVVKVQKIMETIANSLGLATDASLDEIFEASCAAERTRPLAIAIAEHSKTDLEDSTKTAIDEYRKLEWDGKLYALSLTKDSRSRLEKKLQTATRMEANAIAIKAACAMAPFFRKLKASSTAEPKPIAQTILKASEHGDVALNGFRALCSSVGPEKTALALAVLETDGSFLPCFTAESSDPVMSAAACCFATIDKAWRP